MFLNKIFYLLSLWLLLISPRLLKALFKYVFFELCLKMILDCHNVINSKYLPISFSFVDFLMSFGIKIVFIWSFLWPDVPPIDHCALAVPFSFHCSQELITNLQKHCRLKPKWFLDLWTYFEHAHVDEFC